jgi:sortase (surface protein transpeptidase)
VTYKYTIVDSKPVSATTGDWVSVVTSSPTEMLTVITCGGDFNPVTHEYSNRQVVTATRNT